MTAVAYLRLRRYDPPMNATPMTASRRLEQLLLVLSMFVGSISMWLGSPAFWLWLAGRSSKVSSSSMGSLLMVLIGIPVTMVVIGKLLSRLDHRYSASFGTSGTSAHNTARWLASMRGGSDSADEPTMLDKVMVISVGLALLASGVFFAFFSGGSQMRN